MSNRSYLGLSRDADGLVHMRSRLYVPKILTHSGLREQILHDAYHSRFAVNPSKVKMYHDVYRSYWWPRIKRDVQYTMARCVVCQ